MKKVCLILALSCLILTAAHVAQANNTYHVKFDFDTSWTGDYAPGWENSAYRHGAPPIGKMMEQVAGGYTGNGMKLVADSVPENGMWWAAVNPIGVNGGAMSKQYNPYISAWYFDQGWESGTLHQAGQIFAVPSWVNGYTGTNLDEDWTDIQFGARFNQAPPNDNYYYVAAGENSPGWQDTGVDRQTNMWVNLKMQLSSTDGRVHFYLNGNHVGQSYRNDYVDLGETLGLYTMFQNPLSNWGTDKPYTIWDDFEFGSSYIPAPGAIVLAGLGLGLVGWLRRKKTI